MRLPSALAADDGQCVAVVGAGGKKTTLYRLGRMLDRAVVTATVRIPIFDDQVARVVVTDDPVSAVDAHETGGDADGWPLGLVPERERDDRYRGYDRAVVDDLAATHDGPVLVKADGARTRLLKAPDEREPRIPQSADTVLPIASARVVGKPLSDEWVHRPERVAAVADVDLGDEIDAETVARVLASPDGGLKSVPDDAQVVAVVNMVDDDERRAVGERIAADVLARTDRVDRVVLTQLIDPDPVVAVFE
ncbi:selenium cofactor biosynthesis protein YqeC [Salinigranum salinum]|uniref:selenium cofactor biosynthesis protein YqeC n=1 Tax=Salinigranum salinum TaxID=1364937 RepID=UPI001260D976|nr:selenium cofactor biosynthesis protein YqeC [Salinigranum salinum]